MRKKNKNIFFVLLILLLTSCNKNLQISNITGIYKNSDIWANDYNELIIREDSTYSFTQCPNTGDIWLMYDGSWKTKNNSIVLYDGFDFSDYLKLDTLKDYKSDYLYIELDSFLVNRYPEIRLSIDKKKELKLEGNKLQIYKPDYWISNEYDDIPVYIHLRHKNYYAYINYISGCKEIKISLTENIPLEKESKLTKYKIMNDSILDSYSESFKVRSNKLIKLSGLRLDLYKRELEMLPGS